MTVSASYTSHPLLFLLLLLLLLLRLPPDFHMNTTTPAGETSMTVGRYYVNYASNLMRTDVIGYGAVVTQYINLATVWNDVLFMPLPPPTITPDSDHTPLTIFLPSHCTSSSCSRNDFRFH